MKNKFIVVSIFFILNQTLFSQVTPGSIVDEPIDNYLATPAAGSVKNIPVVILRYLPTTDGVNIDVSRATDYWELGHATLDEIKYNIDKYCAGLKFSLEEGSRFHGYKNPDAVPYLGYEVVKFWTIYDQIPISSTFQIGEVGGFDVYEPDFIQVYNDFGLQQYIETYGVKEIWIWFGQCAMPGWPSYDPSIHHPGNFVEFVESNMASPVTGDISNSHRFPDDIPIAGKTAVVYCYNFRRCQAEAVHNHGHQLESIYKYTAEQQDGNYNLFVHDFSGWGANYSSPPIGRAGDCHHPPNTTQDYDYLNPTLVESDIEDWEPAVGPKKMVNADTWANLDYDWPDGYDFPQFTESQWYIYWMQNMPGYGSLIPYNSYYMTNWWELTSDWDTYNFQEVGLYAGNNQVGINADGASPDNSAILDVKANNRGVLIPRISTIARNQIPSPANGLFIYNTTTNQFNFYNGNFWYEIESTIVSATIGSQAVGGGVSISTLPDAMPDNSAMLDVNDVTRGILIPRTTPDHIPVPATGLIIYDISTELLSFFDGNQWRTLCAISTGVSGAGGSQGSTGFTIKYDNSCAHHSAILDISATNKGLLIPRLSNAQRNEILPATGLAIYNTSSNNIEFFNGSEWHQFILNMLESPAGGTHISIPTQITWIWNPVVNATGYKWNTSNNFQSAEDMGTNTLKTESGLVCNSPYTRYVWAYNNSGVSPSTTLTQLTSTDPPGAPSEGTHIPSSTQIIWNWNPVDGANGYKWNTVDDFASALNMGDNTSITETGLVINTEYIRFVWDYNECGNSTSTILTQTTLSSSFCDTPFTVNHVAGSIAPVSKTVTYGVITGIPGEPSKCWITSNLGADHQAIAVNDATEESAGWYWQFNRKQGYKHDGTIITPESGWLFAMYENLDWQAENDPCALELGGGWRIPTSTEWVNVDVSGNWVNWNGPWNSGLNLHAAGSFRIYPDFYYLNSRGSAGYYWGSTQDDNSISLNLIFTSGLSNIGNSLKTFGNSIRCIME